MKTCVLFFDPNAKPVNKLLSLLILCGKSNSIELIKNLKPGIENPVGCKLGSGWIFRLFFLVRLVEAFWLMDGYMSDLVVCLLH